MLSKNSQSGKVDKEVNKIIQEAVIASLGVGYVGSLAVIPVINLMAPFLVFWGGLSGIWTTIVVRLLHHYHHPVSRDLALKLANTVFQGLVTFLVCQAIWGQVLSVVPIVGSFGIITANCFMASYLTYVFGLACDQVFSKEDFEIQDMTAVGQQVLKSMKGFISLASILSFKENFFDKNKPDNPSQ